MDIDEYTVEEYQWGTPEFQIFQQFPKKLYEKDSQRFILGHEAEPTYLIGAYIFRRNKKEVGRFALYDNPGLELDRRSAITFGSFEAEYDEKLVRFMIQFAKEEGKKRRKGYLIGPMEGSTWQSYRFSTHNNHPNFFSEVFHHEYYSEMMHQAGLHVIAHYISQVEDDLAYSEETLKQWEVRLEESQAKVRTLDIHNVKTDLAKIADFCNLAFKRNFLFSPISPSLFVEKYEKLVSYMDLDLVFLVEDNRKNIQALALNFPDHLSEKKDTFIIKTLARNPDRKWSGIGRYLVDKTVKVAVSRGYKRAIHAYMINNNASVGLSKKNEGKAYKSYELYGMPI